MNNTIVNKIINKTREKSEGINAMNIVNTIFSDLNDREKDVLDKRFGLKENKKETLASLGNVHKLTRERIRQIEEASIKKIQEIKELEDHIISLRETITQLLEEHGGLMEKEYLLNTLANLLSNSSEKKLDKEVYKNNFNFLISKFLNNDIEETKNLKHFKNSYKIKHSSLNHLEEIAEDLINKIHSERKMLETKELIEFMASRKIYHKYEEKVKTINNLDITKIFKEELLEEPTNTINDNKTLYSMIIALEKLEQNKFGHWGGHDWKEIKPKTINDKIYLVLKYYDKAMHFTEIAEKINEIKFDKKIANAATIHNELILDNKYILVGRGIYKLRESSNEKIINEDGTVIDVIGEVLKKSKKSLSEGEIIKQVLAKRMVKKGLIISALKNKDIIKKVGKNYTLKK